MNKVELNKMAVDIALGNLQNKLHHIIDGIASAKAFDQYNAKCEEVDQLREALTDIVSLFSADNLLTERGALIPIGHALQAARAALQIKEGE